jgi:hypothetical protein
MKFTASTQFMNGTETIRIGGEVYREFHKMPSGDILCIERDGVRGQGRIKKTTYISEDLYAQVRRAAVLYALAQEAISALTYPVIAAEADTEGDAA